jgi:hypothetical protein
LLLLLLLLLLLTHSHLQVTADSPTNAVSVWDIINLSADSHPIHLHNVDFEVSHVFSRGSGGSVAKP